PRSGNLEEAGARFGLGRIASDNRVHIEAGGPQRAHVREATEAGPRDDDAGHGNSTTHPCAADWRIASSTSIAATPSSNVAGGGSSARVSPAIRAPKAAASLVYGPRSMPVECSKSYAVTRRSPGGGSGAASASSGGTGTVRVPDSSAICTRSPSTHTVPRVPARRVTNSIGPRSL